ncbi:MAG: ABC transporter permease [Lactobacillales bacterium]|jgi:putative ABC transport system permease protein|nr:ABC transporter permease [Lactobacillales bacterium]
MKLHVIWKSSLKALLKNRRRSILTMLGIVIGIASVITILSLGRGFERYTIRSLTQTDSKEIIKEVWFTPTGNTSSNIDFFQEIDLQQVKNIDGVKDARFPVAEQTTLYKDVNIKGKSKNLAIELADMSGQQLLDGRDLTTSDNELKNRVAVVDEVTAKKFYPDPKKAIGYGVEVDGQLFKIVGVFKKDDSSTSGLTFGGSSNIYIPRETYKSYFPNQKGQRYSIEVVVKEGAPAKDVMQKVVEHLETAGTMRSFGEYQTFDVGDEANGISKVLSILTYFISAIAGISLLIAGVGVMNMMYISVSERTKEIGIRRALGATQRDIKWQFLLEGITLSVTGGIVGYLFGMVTAVIISTFLPFSVAPDLFTIVISLGVSTFIGVIFSLMPAAAAARKDLIDILK